MTRHMRRALSLFLAGALFSAGAWGQAETTVRQWVSGDLAIASEYFGTSDGRKIGRDLDDGEGPMVILTIHDKDGVQNSGANNDEIAQVSQGNVARITFKLDGATFAESVSASTVKGYDLGSNAEIDSSVISGGGVGDSSVTFEVEVLGGNITSRLFAATDTSTNDNPSRKPNLSLSTTAGDRDENLPKLVFQVPQLRTVGAGTIFESNADGIPTARGVSVMSSIASRTSRGTPFPEVVQGADADYGSVTNSVNGSIGPKADDIELAQSQVYNTLLPAMVFNWAGPYGSTAEVRVTNRKVIIPFGQAVKDPSEDDPKDAAAALWVGKINITPSSLTGAVRDLGGSDPAVETAGLKAEEYEVGDGLTGDAKVTVFGRFQEDDEIYLGDKAMNISGGVASAEMGIEDLLQSEGEAVIYVPGGVDDLKPGTFLAVAALDFNDSDNAAPGAGPAAIGASVGTVAYRGYSNEGYAYGVVKGGGDDDIDESFVRIGCTGFSGCHVFMDCSDQSGAEYFGEYGDIGPGATVVASSDDIADALGGGWSKGRGSCTMVSKGGLEIQHMVRSHDTLVNNSLVTNKLVAPVPTSATCDSVAALTGTLSDSNTGDDLPVDTVTLGMVELACSLR